MKVFDYVFFRASRFFYKRDGCDADRAIWTVTAIQILLILDLYLSVAYFAFDDRGKRYQQIVASAWCVSLVGVYVLNRLRYQGRYDEIQKAFHETNMIRIVRGIIIVLVLFILFFYPLIFLSLFGKTFLNQ